MIRAALAVSLGLIFSSYSQDAYRMVCWGPDKSSQYSVCPEDEADEIFTKVSAGYNFTLGLRPDGSIKHWGDCSQNVCFIPSGVFTDIFAGINFAYASLENGELVQFGTANQPSLGDVDSDFVKIELADRFHVGLTSDGALWISRGTQSLPSPQWTECLTSPGSTLLIDEQVSDFAVRGSGDLLYVKDGEYYNRYIFKSSEPCDPSIGVVTTASEFSPDPSAVTLHSYASNIYLLKSSGELRSIFSSGSIPPNLLFA